MQRPSPRFSSVRFFTCEIFKETFYLNLWSFAWGRHVGFHLSATNMTAGNLQKHLLPRLAAMKV